MIVQHQAESMSARHSNTGASFVESVPEMGGVIMKHCWFGSESHTFHYEDCGLFATVVSGGNPGHPLFCIVLGKNIISDSPLFYLLVHCGDTDFSNKLPTKSIVASLPPSRK